MKKNFTIFLLLLACLLPLSAQNHLRERVYLSTDKAVYVAGDALWCSAYCVDVNIRRLSGFSSTAYVELHSTDGLACTGKIALEKGRGAGRIDLPNTLPTGNYRLLAYTAQSCNEQGYDYLMGSRIISVFNPLSNDRVKNGVELVGDGDYKALSVTPEASGSYLPDTTLHVEASGDADGNACITLANIGKSPISFDLSVYHDDGINTPSSLHIGDFISCLDKLPKHPSFSLNRIPDYEGEIIRAKVVGIDKAGLGAVSGKFAFFSVPDVRPGVYSAEIDGDGGAVIFTSNIYGNKDLFLEIPGLEEGVVCHLEAESPFVNVNPGEICPLRLCPSLAGSLEARSVSMQIGRAFDSDTLYDFLPVNDSELFSSEVERYNLDDYTRFPLMEETIVEFITELRVRSFEGRRDIQVLMKDSFNNAYFSSASTLAMIDGVPVFDHGKVLDCDPSLIHYVDIYPYTYVIGKRSFSGVVNFITYKGNLPGIKFDDNVRIVSFQGTAYPQAFTCEGVDEAYPDYRQTIFWHPILSLEPGQSYTVKCKTPAYGGRFNIVAEGVSDDLEGIYSQTFIELGPR